MNRILIIDDQKSNLFTAKEALMYYMPDSEVFLAQSGREGVEIAKKEQPDTILLDILMPVIDGFETCKRLKTDSRTRHIPIIMLSAIKKDTKNRIKGLEMGADAFLSKPFDPEELVAMVKVMIRIKSAEDKLREEKLELEGKVEDFHKQLTESRNRLTEAEKIAGIGRWEYDFNADKSYWSDAVYEIFAIKSDESALTYESYLQFIHPEDRQKADMAYNAALTNKKACEVNHRIICRNGTVKYVNDRCTTQFDPSGKPLRSIGTIQDITDRVLVQQALKESEQKFRDYAESSPSMIFVIHNGILVYANKASSKIMKYPLEDFLSGNFDFTKIITKESHALLQESFALHAQGTEELPPKEYTLIGKDGNRISALITTRLIDYEGDKAIMGIVTDITEYKQALQSYQDIDSRYRSLIDISPDGIVVTDIENKFTLINKRAVELLGYDSEKELIGLNSRIMVAEKDHKNLEDKIKESIISGEIENLEVTLLQKDKSEIIVDSVGRVLINEKGEPTGIIVIFRDVTERKRKEEVQEVIYKISQAVVSTESLEDFLLLIRKELSRLMDTTNFFIALYDKEQDTLNLPFFSDQKDSFRSFPAGKSISAHVIKTRKSLLATKNDLLKLRKSGTVEIIGTLAEHWLGIPLLLKEKVIGILVVQSYDRKNLYTKQDQEMLEFITSQISVCIERKEAEDKLKKALEQATKSDKLKTAFLNTMSHELRTPLNAVIGFSEIINNEMPLEEIMEMVKIINDCGNNLIEIVEDIFDITLIQSGEIKAHNEEFNVFNLFLDLHKQFKIKLENSEEPDVELRFAAQEKESLSIHSDEKKIIKITSHLLNNALKYTHDGFIEFGYKKLIKDDNALMQFHVKDTGIGIPEENHEMIFDVFRQGDDSDTRRYQGIGVGLSIAKGLTEIMGGSIWVESRVGAGSTFYFTIPLINVPRGTKTSRIKEVSTNEISFPDKTVLVVEDEDSNHDLIEYILKKLEVKIIWARDGVEATNYCHSNHNIDLVLMDLKMPNKDGFEATLEIKKERPGLPVIAVSAYALDGDNEKAIKAGCDGYIPKPISIKILIREVVKFLSRA